MIKICRGSIALISNSPTKSTVFDKLKLGFAQMLITTRDFSSKTEFETFVTSKDYGNNQAETFCLGIQVENDDVNNFEYSLRFNVTYR